jgi:hypothetical protein
VGSFVAMRRLPSSRVRSTLLVASPLCHGYLRA